MNNRKLAALVVASFAGLVLSWPSLAADADRKGAASEASRDIEMKNQADKNVPRPTDRADKRPATSTKAIAAAKADYQAAVEKCGARPAGERNTCMQVAKDAQSLAMNKARDVSAM